MTFFVWGKRGSKTEYKRFYVSTPKRAPTIQTPMPCPLAESVTELSVGKSGKDESVGLSETVTLRRRNRRACLYGVFLTLSVLSCFVIPFTSDGKHLLSLAASLLTAKDTVACERVQSLLAPLLADGTLYEPKNDSSGKITEATEKAVSDGTTESGAETTETAETAERTDTNDTSNTSESVSEAEESARLKTADRIETLTNETAYAIDFESLAAQEYPIAPLFFDARSESDDGKAAVAVFGEEAPQVLILHTHGTECYADGNTDGLYRTTDTEKNVVRVGKALAEALREKGISVLHCEEMFDADSFIRAYQNSKAAARAYLAEYPSIRYVIDLHRDAVSDERGNYVPLLSEIDGEETAKLMLVVGTDEAGADHAGWRDNLRVAWSLQKHAESSYPTLMRHINLRSASFNQQLSAGYLLLEVGACGGTVEQACRAAVLFSDVFAETVADEAGADSLR